MRNLWLTLLIVLIVAATAWIASEYRNALSRPLAMTGSSFIYTVRPGLSLREVAFDLHEHGLLDRPLALVVHARIEGLAERIKAGEYELRAGATALDFLEKMVAGRVLQRSLTLVEGWSFRQVLDAVARSEYLVHTLEPGLPPDAVMERLGHPGIAPEGKFFPDTYHFPRGTSDVAFLKRALLTMEQHLTHEWENRDPGLPLQTPYEALVLASIVEKETGRADERDAIAGVFIRRLEKGMRLETDPTVIYGLGDAFDGNLTRRDLEQPTPYNTYVHRGLPPTPIATAGLGAIRAVLHPEPGDALFFVAKGDGSHHFSSSYEEHRAAVVRYQIKGDR